MSDNDDDMGGGQPRIQWGKDAPKPLTLPSEGSVAEPQAAEPALDAQEQPVGHKSPPMHSRFKKGKSGNPSGRPRGNKAFDNLIAKEMLASREVTINGRRKKMTTMQIAAKAIAQAAAKGDAKALNYALEKAATSKVMTEIKNSEDPKRLNAADAFTGIISAHIDRMQVQTGALEDGCYLRDYFGLKPEESLIDKLGLRKEVNDFACKKFGEHWYEGMPYPFDYRLPPEVAEAARKAGFIR